MLIAHISDTHVMRASSTDQISRGREQSLRLCIQDINRQGVDVVLHTGDSVQNGLIEEYQFLQSIIDDLEAPLFIVPGNRDRLSAMRVGLNNLDYLTSKSEFLNYTIDNFSVRLIGMDSTLAGERKGFFCQARQDWLEKQLKLVPEKPTLIFFHHPPFDIPAEGYIQGYKCLEQRDDLEDLISRHDQVVQILCGHVHSFNSKEWGRAKVTTMPSLAIDVRKSVDDIYSEAPIYLLHQLGPEKVLSTKLRIVPD
jgi:Icc protein